MALNVVVGFVVRARVSQPNGRLLDKDVSPVYTVRDAAETFMTLYKKTYPKIESRDVWVSEKRGDEIV